MDNVDRSEDHVSPCVAKDVYGGSFSDKRDEVTCIWDKKVTVTRWAKRVEGAVYH